MLLLSGGIDSTTLLAHACNLNFSVHAITFDYGQKHFFEIDAAKKVAKQFPIAEHLIFKLDFNSLKASALTGDSKVPVNRTLEEITKEIPTTYVPGRNIIFLSYAVALSETIGAKDIFFGVNEVDHFGYPDCSESFIEAFQLSANLGTKIGLTNGKEIKIQVPFKTLKKSDVIRLGLNLGVDYSKTSTCYQPSSEGNACGKCDSCILRLAAFKELGVVDPINYR